MHKLNQPVRDAAKALGEFNVAAENAAIALRTCVERIHDTMHDYHMRQMAKKLASES